MWIDLASIKPNITSIDSNSGGSDASNTTLLVEECSDLAKGQIQPPPASAVHSLISMEGV
jgi:hypothetical protein